MSDTTTQDMWAVTASTHAWPCPGCFAMARNALVTARATGSRSGTTGDGTHEATVTRATAVIELT